VSARVKKKLNKSETKSVLFQRENKNATIRSRETQVTADIKVKKKTVIPNYCTLTNYKKIVTAGVTYSDVLAVSDM